MIDYKNINKKKYNGQRYLVQEINIILNRYLA